MKTFKEMVETFNSNYKYTKVTNKKYYITYEFTDGEDNFEVVIRPEPDELKHISVDFYKNDSEEQDKVKNAFKVFSTVLKILQDENYTKYDTLIFSSNEKEKGRTGLYVKFAKEIVKKTSFNSYDTEVINGFTKININK